MIEILLIINIVITICVIGLIFFNKASDPSKKISELIDITERNQDRSEKIIKDEISRIRLESTQNTKQIREEIMNLFKGFGDSIDKRMYDLSTLQSKNFESFSLKLTELIEKNEQKFEMIKQTIEKRLELLQKDNSEKLEKMRETVDEKLTDTLDKRLGEKFKLVSDRLELVHKGLGEMQTLASGVGDLKKVLTNVKTRGTWGEIQLGNLLDQMLTVEQYEKNVPTKKDSADRVEFAIKLPGKDDDIKCVWLPIDSKFPIEDYQRLIEAEERIDIPAIEAASKALETRIKQEAKYIHDKYIDPPYTTDFGILYLPIEGLYAEVTRRLGLTEQLQRDYRVSIAGPNTICAFLNSLQMGFRTLAIEKRSSEVWKILGSIKNEFGKFGDLLDKTSKKLGEASNVLDDASKKTKTIQRALDKVNGIPLKSETIPAIEVIGDDSSLFVN